MSKKPTNWKKNDVNMFPKNVIRDPVGRSSMIIPASVSKPDGACIVVSQYDGTASACAAAYDYGNNGL